MNKFDRSWILFKASLRVMKTHRSLMLSAGRIGCPHRGFAPVTPLVERTGYPLTFFSHWNAALSELLDSTAAARVNKAGKPAGGHQHAGKFS